MVKHPGSSDISGWYNKSLRALDEYRLGVFLNLDCPFSQLVLTESSKNELNNGSFLWLIWTSSNQAKFDFVKDLNLAINSQMTLTTSDGRLFDIHKINYMTPLKVEQIGQWTTSGLNGLKEIRKDNLEGLQLKVMMVLNKLKTNDTNIEERIMDRSLNISSDEIQRFCYIVHQYLRDSFNFKIKVVKTDSWGYYYEHLGHYDGGMFGALEKHDADMGFTPAEQLASRMDVVDWVPPVKKFRACFIFRHPQIFSGYTALLKPLTPTVWLCLLVAVFLSALSLTLISTFKVPDSPGNEPSFSSDLILVIGAMSQQGLASSSMRTSKRIVHIFVLLLSIMTYAFYGAAIVIFLLSPTPITINTIDKLISSPLQLAVEDVPYNKFHFKNRSHPVALKVYNKRIKGRTPNEDKFYDAHYGVEKMRTSLFAFYGHDSNLYRLIEKTFSDSEKCSLTELEAYPPFEISICLRKKFPYKELITRGIIRLRETGIVNREDKFWHPRKPGCMGQEEMVSVGPGSLMTAYTVYTTGVVLCFFLLLIEKFCRKRTAKLQGMKL